MKLIVLYGGIAAGKSTIGRRLEEHGAVRIDADQLARDAVAPGSRGLAAVRERFGDGVLQPDGSLDRPRLGQRVFGDAEALADLNAIVHPEVRRLYTESIDAARAVDADAIVVYEVPLFVEMAEQNRPVADLVVVAEAPAERRVQRLIDFRGMSEDEARSRIASQASDEERRAVADKVIDTSGAEAETLAQADALWSEICA